MKYSEIAAQIKNRITIEMILAAYGFETSKHHRIPCPIHSGNDRNFAYKDAFFKCFVCGESGDVISLVQKIFALDFTGAIAKLNSDFALNLPIDRRATLREHRQMNKIESAMQKKKEERAKIEKQYAEALEHFTRLDRNIRLYKPSETTQELHPLFVEAMRDYECAKNRLNMAEMEVYMFDSREQDSQSCADGTA